MTSVLSVLVSAALVCQSPEPAGAPDASVMPDSTHRQLFEAGRSFAEFMAKAERRKEQWDRNFREAVVPDALLARARAAAGPWKFLVVAVDGCSDSVNTIPYLAKLVQQLMGAELRIVGSDVGRAVMDAHKTPDGRGATPTVVLLDATYAERGCWVERPSVLQQWIADQKGKAKDDEIFERKMKWYDDDKGLKTLEELVEMMERAGRGERACAAQGA